MVFENMTNYKSHLFSEHSINGSGLYECSTCGKSFASKSVLQKHVIRVGIITMKKKAGNDDIRRAHHNIKDAFLNHRSNEKYA